MYFRLTADAAELVEPENVTAFSVRSDLGGADLAAAVERAALGAVLPDGEHVMIDVAAIRRLAGTVPAGWEDDLAGMLAYAQKKGWTSEDGSAVRAHVER
ncbi:hypothetical protein [Pseudonocardia sp. WMMC193]|uniref:hypothetical protein n=1 Tax=Pseudonocardia sp. WMMC193 TaxID=2911965 RepID=UPI001F1F1336|nr:hypothetical protein [Pseudonocardia sp. WMMC193]MCF7549924.1 hypothetical protein [Pseudonocardia sp. WMMC193]